MSLTMDPVSDLHSPTRSSSRRRNRRDRYSTLFPRRKGTQVTGVVPGATSPVNGDRWAVGWGCVPDDGEWP